MCQNDPRISVAIIHYEVTGNLTDTTIRAIELDACRVLRIGGEDRLEFLQGQLTQDVTHIGQNDTARAGWASAKGRLFATGQLLGTDEALLWPLPADIVEGVARRLGMFRLRAQVDLAVVDWSVFGLCDLDPQAELSIGDLRIGPDGVAATTNAVGARVLGDPARAWLCGPTDTLRQWCETGSYAAGAEAEWRLLDIRAGLPSIVAATSETFIPQMLNLDLLDGISFTKGCYVGQEIVARTQNLGRIKRRMYRFSAEGKTRLEPGATIYGPATATGKVVMTAPTSDGIELTAVIAIEQAEEEWFADEARTARLTQRPLPYVISAPE